MGLAVCFKDDSTCLGIFETLPTFTAHLNIEGFAF